MNLLLIHCGFRLLSPALSRMNPETAHKLTIQILKRLPQKTPQNQNPLSQKLLGLTFPNPLGIAAGFDKNAETLNGILQLGLGFAEIGTITPKPQMGNPRPRIFRLPKHQAVINRMGFPNDGMEKVRKRFIRQQMNEYVVGVNIGANAESANMEDKIADYEKTLHAFANHASYIAVNVSSPNTKGLRNLQRPDNLAKLLNRLNAIRQNRVPLLLKISPDLSDQELQEIARLALEKKLDGIIATNTTIKREGLVDGIHAEETGGLSGKPLASLANQTIRKFYQMTNGAIPIIGVGGIASAEEAYEKIRAGASLLQIYTALVYDGPRIVSAILDGLEALLKKDGYRHISEAIGADHRPKAEKERRRHAARHLPRPNMARKPSWRARRIAPFPFSPHQLKILK